MEQVLGADLEALLFNFLRNTVMTPPVASFDVRDNLERWDWMRSGATFTSQAFLTLEPVAQRWWYELFTQYLIAFGLSRDVQYPDDLLDGCGPNELGPRLLAFFGNQRWPFPNELPRQ